MSKSEFTAAKLIESWRREGVRLNSGAAEASIIHLERRFQVRVPPTLREYLMIADGMPLGSTDSNMIRFWPVAEIVPLAEGAPESLGDAASECGRALLFADYCIWSHAYAVQPDAPNHVLLVVGERPVDLKMQFDEFVDAYMSRGVLW